MEKLVEVIGTDTCLTDSCPTHFVHNPAPVGIRQARFLSIINPDACHACIASNLCIRGYLHTSETEVSQISVCTVLPERRIRICRVLNDGWLFFFNSHGRQS